MGCNETPSGTPAGDSALHLTGNKQRPIVDGHLFVVSSRLRLASCGTASFQGLPKEFHMWPSAKRPPAPQQETLLWHLTGNKQRPILDGTMSTVSDRLSMSSVRTASFPESLLGSNETPSGTPAGDSALAPHRQ